jgi:predicted SAM-dependent methyltransferase
MNLRELLIKEHKTRWLDIGSGGNFEQGFEYLDVFPIGLIPDIHRNKYHRMDILAMSQDERSSLGTFDLVRLQHTFEHFSFEEARVALRSCAALLDRGGLLLISVPDLRKHINQYTSGSYKDWNTFTSWAHQRIPNNAPASMYFAIFAYSMTFESHRWLYDSDGLRFIVELDGQFKNSQELTLDNSLSIKPFTHNRPDEDLCILAFRS